MIDWPAIDQGHTRAQHNADVIDLQKYRQFYKAFLNLEAKKTLSQGVILTEREQEVLMWYAMGKSRSEIAIIMGVTSHVVKFHLKSIFVKLDVQNDRVAVLKAASLGLIPSRVEVIASIAE